MSAKIFRFIRHERVQEYVALGWTNTQSLKGTHHGEYSELLEWTHDRAPEEPTAEVIPIAS